MSEQKSIMSSIEINRALKRIAHEIVEKNKGVENVILVGIRTLGVPLAHKLAAFIEEIEGVEIPVGTLDITMYRDDLSSLDYNPVVHETEIDMDINKKVIVLVDDVLYTGRTIRAALDAIMDMGRPQAIQLAVLVDRGHRELPIRADYAGKNVPTSRKESVDLLINEEQAVFEVVITKIED